MTFIKTTLQGSHDELVKTVVATLEKTDAEVTPAGEAAAKTSS